MPISQQGFELAACNGGTCTLVTPAQPVWEAGTCVAMLAGLGKLNPSELNLDAVFGGGRMWPRKIGVR